MKRTILLTTIAVALAGCNPLPPPNMSKEKWLATGSFNSVHWPYGTVKSEICHFQGGFGGMINYEMSNSECNAVNGKRPYMGTWTEADVKAAGW